MDTNTHSLKLLGDPLAITVKKIEIAASYAGVELEIVDFDPNKASGEVLKDFLKKSPSGLTPVLETEEGCLYEVNAILRYIGRFTDDNKLYGNSLFEKALVDQYLDWSTLTLEPVYAQYIMPYLGYTIYNKKAHEQSFKSFKELLSILEERLKKSRYIVNGEITLPDIQVVSLLSFSFRYNFDEKLRKAYPALTKYYEDVANQENFKIRLGRPFLCKTALKPHQGPR